MGRFPPSAPTRSKSRLLEFLRCQRRGGFDERIPPRLFILQPRHQLKRRSRRLRTLSLRNASLAGRGDCEAVLTAEGSLRELVKSADPRANASCLGASPHHSPSPSVSISQSNRGKHIPITKILVRVAVAVIAAAVTSPCSAAGRIDASTLIAAPQGTFAGVTFTRYDAMSAGVTPTTADIAYLARS
jgi:hypothetical protein